MSFSVIFWWSSPSNFSRFSATSLPCPYLIKKSAIFPWSSPWNLSSFWATAHHFPLMMSALARFSFRSGIASSFFKNSESGRSFEVCNSSVMAGVIFIPSSAKWYLSVCFAPFSIRYAVPFSQAFFSLRVAVSALASSSLYCCWSSLRLFMRGCSGLISALECSLFMFLLFKK